MQKQYQRVVLVLMALVVALAPAAFAERVLSGSVDTAVVQQTPVYDSSPGVVGLDLVIRPGGFPMVRDVFNYSPAYTAGLRPGDKILAINGNTTANKSKWQVDEEISDIPGVVVELTLQRGQTVKTVNVRVAALSEVHPALRSYYVSSSPF